MKTTHPGACAFLNCALGGTGQQAGRHVVDLAAADGRPFPMLNVGIDTDPQIPDYFDLRIPIGLSGEQVATIRADPEAFGPEVVAIARNYPQFLNPEDVGCGARTIRALTQLAVGYHRERLARSLRDAVLKLLHQGGFETIIPVLFSSSGGGTGSALQVLLPRLLQTPAFLDRLTEGMPSGLIQTPILFVVEPYALAMRNQPMHADKVMANAFALRIETAMLEASNAFKYCFHLGLANKRGAVLDSPEEIAKVLGTAVYQLERHWLTIKARFVDTVDSNALTARYSGRDVPEHRMSQFLATSSNGVAVQPARN